MVSLLRATCQNTFFSKQRQSGMLAGHVGFLCTNKVGWVPILFFGGCKPGRGANVSKTQRLKGSHIPHFNKEIFEFCVCLLLNSTNRKDHL